jgi:hypothetical protein
MNGISEKVWSTLWLPTTINCFVRWALFLLVAYWGVFALVTPVTVWDSHVYNLARLAVADRNGLFGNILWTSERQVIFPWSFDSIHLPFLSLGWGYALPSYACLLGTAWILFQMIYHTAGLRTALLAVLSLFAMPTVIYQATSTKNDMGVVFVAAFATYGLFRFREQMNPKWVLLSAFAVGFLPGIKSSGLHVAFFLSIGTIWLLSGQKRLIASWALAVTTSFCLLGSLEIYINNVYVFGNPLGKPSFLALYSNQDGIGGTIANTIRYLVGIINPGLEPCCREPAWQLSLETTCRNLLQTLQLTDKGYGPDFSDQRMRFLKIGWESASDFGPLGTVAMLISVLLVLTFRKNQPAFWVALSGWVLLVTTAATIAWMPWNMRFLMLPMVLFAVAALLTVRPLAQRSWAFAGIVGFILYGATVYPLCSFNKQPGDMVKALLDREAATLKERESMEEILDAVRKFHADSPETPWLLHAGSDSWVLGLLTMPDLKIRPAPKLERETLKLASEETPFGEVFILVLNRKWFPPADGGYVRKLVDFKWEKDSSIYVRCKSE